MNYPFPLLTDQQLYQLHEAIGSQASRSMEDIVDMSQITREMEVRLARTMQELDAAGLRETIQGVGVWPIVGQA